MTITINIIMDKYTRRNGEEVDIKEMDTDHLINSYHYFRRKRNELQSDLEAGKDRMKMKKGKFGQPVGIEKMTTKDVIGLSVLVARLYDEIERRNKADKLWDY